MLDEEAKEIKIELTNLMLAQTRLLEVLIHQLVNKEAMNEDEKFIEETIRMMLQSIGVSTRSILKLTGEIDMGIRDCFGIARTVCEMSVNVAYIVASDIKVAKRAQMHALQKFYRDLYRVDDKGAYKFIAQADKLPDPQKVEGLIEALEAFTKKNGQEIRSWSPKSLDQKIDEIYEFNKKASLSLKSSKFIIYRHSSELLHGSFFGVKFFWTSQSGAIVSRDEIESHWVKSHFVSIFGAVFFGTAGVIETCIQRFDLQELKKPLDNLFKKANKIILNEEDLV